MAKYTYDVSLEGKKKKGGTVGFSKEIVFDSENAVGDSNVIKSKMLSRVKSEYPDIFEEYNLSDLKVVLYSRKEKIEDPKPRKKSKSKDEDDESDSAFENLFSSPYWLIPFRLIWGIVKVIWRLIKDILWSIFNFS